jgi:NAD(P)-dependent dehydrogenase (short-subunit alcohol dehydrogenase family)
MGTLEGQVAFISPSLTPTGRVAGKVIVVTGAAQGQGAVEARALVREGASVLGLDVREPAEPVENVDHRVLDVTDADGWRRLAGELRAEHGAIHGLVNNAGVTSRTRLADVTAEEMARVMAINVTGPLLGIQALSPVMTEGGSIVNVSSIAGTTGHFPPAYTASKWALRGVSRAASAELGHLGIRVNAIMPGVIAAPMVRTPDTITRMLNEEIPLGRPGTGDDVAPLIVFLMSDESAWISGAEIAVDGGQAGHGGMKRLSDAHRNTTTNTNQEERP